MSGGVPICETHFLALRPGKPWGDHVTWICPLGGHGVASDADGSGLRRAPSTPGGHCPHRRAQTALPCPIPECPSGFDGEIYRVAVRPPLRSVGAPPLAVAEAIDYRRTLIRTDEDRGVWIWERVDAEKHREETRAKLARAAEEE